jgi:transcriptional regulator with XRE-family HTH domain
MGMVVRNTLAFTKITKMPYKKNIPENPQTLGEHILRKRLQLRLLQVDVASLIGVSEDSITGWETGRSAPQIHLYPAIITFLDYYPFEKEMSTVSGRIMLIRYSNGWTYEQLAAEFGVNARTVLGWQRKNQVFAERERRILYRLLQQCLS